MPTVANKIIRACKARQLSLAHVCKLAGVNYKTLHAQIKNERAIPYKTVDLIADALSLPMEYFSRRIAEFSVTPVNEQSELAAASTFAGNMKAAQLRAIQQGSQITTDDVLDWLRSQNGRLQNFDKIKDRVDLYQRVEPYHSVMLPSRLGKQSLATIWFELENEADFVRKVQTFDQNLIVDIMEAHVEVMETNRFKVDDVAINITLEGRRISEEYRRVMARVTDENNEPYVLVYAQLLT